MLKLTKPVMRVIDKEYYGLMNSSLEFLGPGRKKSWEGMEEFVAFIGTWWEAMSCSEAGFLPVVLAILCKLTVS